MIHNHYTLYQNQYWITALHTHSIHSALHIYQLIFLLHTNLSPPPQKKNYKKTLHSTLFGRGAAKEKII